jgi:hypothetical protein
MALSFARRCVHAAMLAWVCTAMLLIAAGASFVHASPDASRAFSTGLFQPSQFEASRVPMRDNTLGGEQAPVAQLVARRQDKPEVPRSNPGGGLPQETRLQSQQAAGGAAGSVVPAAATGLLDFVGGQSRQSGRTRSARHGSQKPTVGTAPPEQWQEPDSRERPASAPVAQLEEHPPCKGTVRGSNPRVGSMLGTVRAAGHAASGADTQASVVRLASAPSVRGWQSRVPAVGRIIAHDRCSSIGRATGLQSGDAGSTPASGPTSTEQQVTKSAEHLGRARRRAPVSEGLTDSIEKQRLSRQPASLTGCAHCGSLVEPGKAVV